MKIKSNIIDIIQKDITKIANKFEELNAKRANNEITNQKYSEELYCLAIKLETLKIVINALKSENINIDSLNLNLLNEMVYDSFVMSEVENVSKVNEIKLLAFTLKYKDFIKDQNLSV